MRSSATTTLLTLALCLACAQAAGAVTELELGLAAQGGYQMLLGDTQDALDGGPCFGVNIAYGLSRWFALSGDVTYGMHSESHEDDYGKIDFTLLTLLVGPRFTLDLDPVFPYAELLAGGAVWRYEVEYERDDGTAFDDDEQRGRAAVGGAVGLDAALSDSFQLGLLGRYVQLFEGIDLPNADKDLRDEPLSTLQIMLRASLVF